MVAGSIPAGPTGRDEILTPIFLKIHQEDINISRDPMDEAEYIKNLPRKRMASGVVFLNEGGQPLLVKPTYRDHWSIPGGVIEKDESPRAAAIREIEEELGLSIDNPQFLAIDYMSPAVSGYATKDENIQFIFYGGKLTAEQIQSIKLPADELSEYKFVDLAEALELVNPNLARRLPISLEALSGGAAYLEGGNK